MTYKPLTLVCVQPCIPYYAWQVEVMLNNFKNIGLHNKYGVQCLFAFNKNESDWESKVAIIKKVENAFTDVASFYYYEDTRQYPISYISSIRPNVLKQHAKAFPTLFQFPTFYHDCDIVFTKFPDFLDNILANDMNWYVSNTISYIGHNYIISKGDNVLSKMCEIVGINSETVKERESQSGGAQYVIKNVDWVFFEKVEKDCERLYKEINILSNEIKRENPQYHELQIWCADMWAILWNAWIRGFNTEIIPEMDFCWATDGVDNWKNKYIYHNAGVTDAFKTQLFYKGDFRSGNFPYDIDESGYDKTKASFNYLMEIKSVGTKTCLK